MYIYIYMYICSFCTVVHSGPLVYIDDSYQKARPLYLGPSLACMHTHTHTHTHSHSLTVCCVAQQTCRL